MDVRIQQDAFQPPKNHFGESKFKEYFLVKWSFNFCLHDDLNDLISTHMNDKWLSNTKSAHQTTPGVQNSKNDIWCHQRSLTSVDLGKVAITVQIMDVTSQHLSMWISPVEIPKFASYMRRNATERKLRLTWPWKSGHRFGYRTWYENTIFIN